MHCKEKTADEVPRIGPGYIRGQKKWDARAMIGLCLKMLG